MFFEGVCVGIWLTKSEIMNMAFHFIRHGPAKIFNIRGRVKVQNIRGGGGANFSLAVI